METKTIIEYFDIGKYEHLKAWQHLSQTGSWPIGFWNEIKHLDFPPDWNILIMAKMSEAYLNTILKSMELGKE